MNTVKQPNDNHPIHPLSLHMMEDMRLRRFNPDTQRDYLRHVKQFSEFLGHSPDKADAEDIRRFQLGMEAQGVSADTSPRIPVKLPEVLTPGEVAQLIHAARHPKYKAIFATAYGAGLRVSEVVSLKVTDIDSDRMMLRM
jgi:integrase/recombinase XerD